MIACAISILTDELLCSSDVLLESRLALVVFTVSPGFGKSPAWARA